MILTKITILEFLVSTSVEASPELSLTSGIRKVLLTSRLEWNLTGSSWKKNLGGEVSRTSELFIPDVQISAGLIFNAMLAKPKNQSREPY